MPSRHDTRAVPALPRKRRQRARLPFEYPLCGLLACLVLLWGACPAALLAGEPIRSAAERDYPPFSIVDAAGRIDGFAIELFREALAAMDREVTFRTGTWAEVRGWLEKGEIQALPLVGRTPEREKLFDFTFPYMSLHGAIVVRKDNTDIRSLQDLRGRRVAVMKGDNAEEFLRQEDRGIGISTTPSFEVALRELARGQYDAVVTQRLVALRLIQETGLANLRVIDQPIEGFRQDFCFAVREGDRDTLALLNEGLAIVMADGTYRHLHAKWFAALQLPLNRRIIIGGDHNYPPFEYLDENGRPTGFATELTRAIAREMGLDIEFRLGPWSEILRQLENGEIDVIQGMFYSPRRDLKYDFTQPYAADHYVSVVRSGDLAPPGTPGDLAGLRIVIQRGDVIEEFLAEKGLDDQVSVADTQEDVLRQLAEGKHDCALVVRVSALHLIREHGWTGLDIGRRPVFTTEYCYAVLQGQSALLAQFSEGLKTLEGNGGYRRLHEKWLGVYRGQPPSMVAALRNLLLVLVPLLLALLAFSLWSWSLRRQVAKKTMALRQSEEFQRAMIACSPVALYSIDQEGKVLTWNSSAERIFQWTAGEIIGRRLPIIPEDRENEFRGLVQKVLAEGGFSGKEVIRRRKDGSLLNASLSAAPIRDVEGKVIGIMSAMEDITERKRSEEILRYNEELLREMGRVAGIGGWEYNRENGKWTWTGETARIHDMDPAGGITLEKDLSFYHGTSRARMEKAIADAIAEGRPFDLELELTTARGKRKWVRTIGKPIKENGRVVRIRGSIQDITEIHATRRAILESRENLRITLNSIGDAVIAADTDGRVLRMNPVAENLTGWPLAEARGKPLDSVFQIFNARTGRKLDDPVRKVLRSGHVVDLPDHTRLIAKNGRSYQIADSGAPIRDENGTVTGVVIVFRDITEEYRMREALQQSEKLLKEAQAVGRVGSWLFDFSSGKASLSDAYLHIIGLEGGRDYSIEDLRNIPLPEYRDLYEEAMRQLVEGEGRFDIEYQVKRAADGRIVDIHAVAEYNRHTNTATGIIQDITERRRLEAQLLQAQKLESVGRLAGGVAHDYNNMLSVIVGYAEMALEKIPPHTQLHEDLGEILKAGKRSAEITRQLLTFARRQTISPEVLDLNATVEGMLKMLRRLLGENLDLNWRPATGLWPVRIDPTQVDQILANLCVNARDAIEGVGKVVIATENVTLDENYCTDHLGFSPGDYVLLTVSDDGCGMDSATRDKIFEPFFTTKGAHRGTGLGLATVYGIVRQNNGFINVYSEPGSGATFRIYLPRHRGAMEEKISPGSGNALMGRGETVLLVEDEPTILQMTKTMLERLNYRVLAANTPAEAKRLAGEHGDAIGLLITDVIMPEMNGRQLADQVCPLCPDLGILFMSGYTADVIARHGVLEKGVFFIQKPFSREQLAAKVRQALHRGG